MLRRAKSVILETPTATERMLDTGIVQFLLKKAGPVAGPLILAAAVGAFAAWKGRAVVDGGETIKAKVEHLDSVTVKKDELRASIESLHSEIKNVGAQQDSTNRLLRRVICQKQTIILCQGDK